MTWPWLALWLLPWVLVMSPFAMSAWRLRCGMKGHVYEDESFGRNPFARATGWVKCKRCGTHWTLENRDAWTEGGGSSIEPDRSTE